MRNISPILLDSNVLVYSQNTQSKYYKQAQAALDQAINGNLKACLALQNITEAIAILTDAKRFSHPLSHREIIKLLNIFSNLEHFKWIFPNSNTVELLSEWFQNGLVGKSQQIFDAQLAATMLSNGVKTILTANTKDFAQFPGIEVIDLRKS